MDVVRSQNSANHSLSLLFHVKRTSPLGHADVPEVLFTSWQTSEGKWYYIEEEELLVMKIEELKKIYKNKKEVLCALCATPRILKHERHLSAKNYLQLIMTTAFTTWALFENIGYNGLFSFFLYWTILEFTKKFLYRKEVTCPHCGFDATWYKRDVAHARKKVEKFWDEKASLKADRSETHS